MGTRHGWGLAALLCAAAGVALWWSARDERPARATGTQPAEAAAAAHEGPVGPAPLRAIEPAPADGAAIGPVAEGGSAREALGARPRSAEDLVVRALGPDGAPVAGIPLRLVPAADDPTHSFRHVRTAESDGSGRAVFEGVRAELRASPSPWGLQVPIPCAAMPDLRLSAARLAEPEVVVHLAPGGALEVVVLEDVVLPGEGETTLDGTGVELVRVPEGFEREPRLPAGTPSWRTTTRGARALFPWVELGRAWELRCRPPGLNYVARARADGPATLRARATVEVRLAADEPVLRFRALDERGTPLAKTALRLERRNSLGSGKPETIAAETDEAGRFSLVTAFDPFATGVLLVRTGAGREERCGRVRLPRERAGGAQDGGDVVLGPPPLLVSGRVVDERGEGVRAIVKAALDLSQAPGEWGGPLELVTRSNDHGAFVLRGLLDQEAFQLVAWAGEVSSEPIDVHEGERELELVVRGEWGLSLRLLVDPWLDSRRVVFRLTPAGPASKGPFEARGYRLPGGAIQLGPLLAGEYDLACTLDGRVLRELADIDLRRDTDLGLVDLTDLTRDYTLALLGGPEPLAGRFAWQERGAAKPVSASFAGRSLHLQVPTHEPVDVWIHARGCRSVLVAGVSESRTVVLEAPFAVRLVLDTAGELPRHPYALRCELAQGDEVVSEGAGADAFTAENRELALTVSRPGALRVRWILERRFDTGNSSGARSTRVLGGEEYELEILEVAGEQRFVVRLDGAALTALTREPPW